jgi:hypothetical protein
MTNRDPTTQRDPALDQLDMLIGTWSTESTHPLVDQVLSGSASFEWLEGGHFLIQRARTDHELFPDAISIIGARVPGDGHAAAPGDGRGPNPGDGLIMEYFDSRGVRRTYGVSLDEGVLRFLGHFPEFDQRFSARLATDAFVGQWQLARTAGDWQDDLKLDYRRLR